jgi:hypothetical protein
MGPGSPEPSPELFDELEAEAENASTNGEIIIVGSPECPNCGAVKKLFEEEMGEAVVRYVDIDTPEGKQINTLFDGIEAVPFITYHDREKQRYTKCELVPEGNDMEEAIWTIVCDVKNAEMNRTLPVG